MSMKVIKKTEAYTIFRRNDERYAVKDLRKKYINGVEKTRILIEEGLIKAVLPENKEEVVSGTEQPESEEVAKDGVPVPESSPKDTKESEVAVEEHGTALQADDMDSDETAE